MRPPDRAAGLIAILVRDLEGGGVQRAMMTLGGAFAARGHAVDLVTFADRGSLRATVPDGLRLVTLPPGSRDLGRLLALAADPGGLRVAGPAMLAKRRPSPTIGQLGALAAYLRRERPAGVVSGTTQLNVEAVWARRLARWPGHLVLTERVHLSSALASGNPWRRRYLPALVARTYPQADAVVAVADALGDDLAEATGLPRGIVRTIHNPIVGPEIAELARVEPDHPWMSGDGPPVVLAAGRLEAQKDLPTLIRAFAHARRRRPLRLVILGAARRPEVDGTRRRELAALAAELGVAAEVDLPGFVANPFAFMARAAVFALSSRHEGLPAVLAQAMACGCPVVSTDCPTGPAEMLDGGRVGPLVPVGDAPALGEAILRTLETPPPRWLLDEAAARFSVDRAVAAYEALLLPGGGSRPA